MSKTAKSVIIAIIVFLSLFAISMIFACCVFMPLVTLDYGYPKFDWSFGGTVDVEVHNMKDCSYVTRFSHYDAPTPTRDNYTFCGWYYDLGYTTPYVNGKDTIDRDTTLYAKWVKDN